MRAASSSSSGTAPVMYWRIQKMPKALAAAGTMSAWQRAHPAELRHDHELRDERELGRQHVHEQQQSEQELVAGEVELGEGEGGQRVEEQHQRRHAGGDDERVEHRAEEVDAVEQVPDVGEELGAEHQLRRVAEDVVAWCCVAMTAIQ